MTKSHTYTHTHTHTYGLKTELASHTQTHTYGLKMELATHTHVWAENGVSKTHRHMHKCMHTCMHTHTHTHTGAELASCKVFFHLHEKANARRLGTPEEPKMQKQFSQTWALLREYQR